MSGSAFAVTHHAFSSGAGRTSDGNGSHASTLKLPSYTKSVSWQHYPKFPLILKDTCYYTSFSKKSLDEYVIKYGHGFVGNTCNENIPSPPAATNNSTNNSSEHVNVYSKKQ